MFNYWLVQQLLVLVATCAEFLLLVVDNSVFFRVLFNTNCCCYCEQKGDAIYTSLCLLCLVSVMADVCRNLLDLLFFKIRMALILKTLCLVRWQLIVITTHLWLLICCCQTIDNYRIKALLIACFILICQSIISLLFSWLLICTVR